jgi:hypothetical protein
MSLRRFPILLTSTLIVAATALLAPADAAEQRSFWGFFAPHVDVEVSVGHTCPPPAPVCAQPVHAPPVREIVWVDGFPTYDAYGCRSWVPGHYEERYRVQPEYRQPAPRCPEPASRFPEHGGPLHHDDDRGRGHDDDRYRGHGDDRGPDRRDDHGRAFHR